MKILIISNNSPERSIGGIERYISNLLEFCPSLPYEFIFILPTSKKRSYEKKGNISIYRRSFFNFVPEEVFGKKTISKNQIKTKSEEFFKFLNELFKKEKIDVIEIQDSQSLPSIFSFALHMASLNHKIPLLLRLHSFPSTEIKEAIINDLPWKKIECVSKSIAGDIFSKGTPIEAIDVKYLGVNTDKFFPDKNQKYLKNKFKLSLENKIILHASRITDGKKSILKEKGIISLMEAFSKLTSKYPEYILAIATAFPPEVYKKEFEISLAKINDYARLYNIEQKVFCQKFELNEMPKVYQGSNLFVLDSENETFGQVYLESMACGLPVIGTNVGGIPEIISNNNNGFLIPPNNPAFLAQKIEELIVNKEIRENFISEGIKTINEKFSVKNLYPIYFKYIKEEILK